VNVEIRELTTEDLAGATRGNTAQDEPLVRERDESGGTRPAAPDESGAREPLVAPDQAGRFTDRWREVQADFVDRPRESVQAADALVAELMQLLASSFSDERGRLEQQWDGGNDVSTEDLRVALTRYRSFFDRLLSA
jgi:hypothetical protein